MILINTLIVDDHHLMLDAYRAILEYHVKYKFKIVTAVDSEECYNIIEKINDESYFNLVILDLAIPPFIQQSISGGGDLANLFKKRFPNCKVVIITSHVQAFTLYDLTKLIRPDGLMVKSDFNGNQLLEAIEQILEGDKYYSPTVLNQIYSVTSQLDYLDTYNRKIISFLAQGIKSKNLPYHLPLSMSAIDKRKSQIKDHFFLAKATDEDIIREAKRFGYI